MTMIAFTLFIWFVYSPWMGEILQPMTQRELDLAKNDPQGGFNSRGI